MKTKQLLEIIFKSIAIFILIPRMIYFPVDMYYGIIDFRNMAYGEYSTSKTAFVFAALFLVYVLFIYYLLVRTEVVVRWVYKENEDEKPINLKWHSRDIIYIVVVITALYSLFNLAPFYFVKLIRSLDFSDTQQSIYNSFKPFDSYFYQNTAQLITSILILLNARRITAWIDVKRKKKTRNTSKEIE